jgi:hypothetical protein
LRVPVLGAHGEIEHAGRDAGELVADVASFLPRRRRKAG